MRITVELDGSKLTISSNEPTSSDVLALVGSSDLVRARMGNAPRAVFNVQIRKAECSCESAKIPCRCKPAAPIVEVGDRVE